MRSASRRRVTRVVYVKMSPGRQHRHRHRRQHRRRARPWVIVSAAAAALNRQSRHDVIVALFLFRWNKDCDSVNHSHSQ